MLPNKGICNGRLEHCEDSKSASDGGWVRHKRTSGEKVRNWQEGFYCGAEPTARDSTSCAGYSPACNLGLFSVDSIFLFFLTPYQHLDIGFFIRFADWVSVYAELANRRVRQRERCFTLSFSSIPTLSYTVARCSHSSKIGNEILLLKKLRSENR